MSLLMVAGVLAPVKILTFRTCHAMFQPSRRAIKLEPMYSPPRPMVLQMKRRISNGQTPMILMLAAAADEGDESYEWQVGNVYDDIEILDRIIKIHEASGHLQQVKRREMLDNFAAQRRPILPDLVRFIIAPIGMAFIMAKISNKSRIIRFFQQGFDVQFWSTFVMIPLFLLRAKRRSMPPHEPMPEELERIEPEFRHFVTHIVDWEDPEKSCRDVVLALIEFWVSSIAGTALLGVSLVLTKQQKLFFGVPFAILQVLTRIGVVASLNQFPKLLYELRREPLPLTQGTVQMQKLTQSVLWTAPIGVASDLSKLFSGLSLLPKIPPSKVDVLWAIPFFFAALGPLAHLMAIKRLFRVQKTHDISLATERETLRSILSNAKEMSKRTKWRYRLNWREPQRLTDTIPTILDNAVYRLFFQGTVPDKLMKESQATIRRSVFDECNNRIASTERGKNVPIPSTEWKSRAMEVLASEHQRDYDSGNFKDPLGVAVQQTFGIGLAYGFDHMTPLREGEEPTSRRLQARTAKSAIRRVQMIYDAEAAKQELRQIADPSEQDKKKQEMRQRSEAEIHYLRDTLAKLVPIDKSDPIPVKIFREKPFKKISPKEFLLIEEDIDDTDTVDNLTQKLTRNLDDNDSSEATLEAPTMPDIPENGDEFITAWQKQRGYSASDDVLA